MSKFLNSEQAKADETEAEQKTLEELETENERLRGEKAALERRLKIFGEQIGQYAIRIAELELQYKEMTAR